ncbi:hypothetical protein BT69DRAFT_1354088 [Atractiella rhizophila]|nr:hypothetical protein BT69DRAFT_1354088 [Atractiella rhizophila]
MDSSSATESTTGLLQKLESLQFLARNTEVKAAIDEVLNVIQARNELLDEQELERGWHVVVSERFISRHQLRLIPLLRPSASVPRTVPMLILSRIGRTSRSPWLKYTVQQAMLRWLVQTYEWWSTSARMVVDRLYCAVFRCLQMEECRRDSFALLWLITRKEHILHYRVRYLLTLRMNGCQDSELDLLLRLYAEYIDEPIFFQYPFRPYPIVFPYPDPRWREGVLKSRSCEVENPSRSLCIFLGLPWKTSNEALLRIVHGYRTDGAIRLRLSVWFAEQLLSSQRWEFKSPFGNGGREATFELLKDLVEVNGFLFEGLENQLSQALRTAQDDFWQTRILDLLPWLKPMPLATLVQLFLDRLVSLSKLAPLADHIRFLEALNRLIENWASYELPRSTTAPERNKFVAELAQNIEEISKEVQRLSTLCLLEHPHSLRLRYTMLSFYNTVSQIPSIWSIPSITIPDQTIAYASLTSDIGQLSLLLATLNRMKETFQSGSHDLRTRQQALVNEFNGLLSAVIDGLWRDKMWMKADGKIHPPVATSTEVDCYERLMQTRGQSGDIVLGVSSSSVYLALVNQFIKEFQAKAHITAIADSLPLRIVDKELAAHLRLTASAEGKTTPYRHFRVAFVDWLSKSMDLPATELFCASLIKHWGKYKLAVVTWIGPSTPGPSST